MPIHEYVDPNGTRHERIYLSGDVIPAEIETPFGIARRVISSPTIRFKGPFSGGTPRKNMVTDLGKDVEALDEGGKRRIKEIAQEKKAATDKKRADFLHEQLRTYDI